MQDKLQAEFQQDWYFITKGRLVCNYCIRSHDETIFHRKNPVILAHFLMSLTLQTSFYFSSNRNLAFNFFLVPAASIICTNKSFMGKHYIKYLCIKWLVFCLFFQFFYLWKGECDKTKNAQKMRKPDNKNQRTLFLPSGKLV